MNHRTTLITTYLIAASLISGAAHAALQGRDLNGTAGSFEAYYDTVLEITWLADANYAQTSGYDADGRMTWGAANIWAASLSFTDGVNVYDNWRLPTIEPVSGTTTFNYNVSFNGSTDVGYNISAPASAYPGSTGSELPHLFYNTLGNPGHYTPTGEASGCAAGYPGFTCVDNDGPFTNLRPDVYWSGTEHAPGSNYRWDFNMTSGGQTAHDKSYGFYAWAVSPGDVAAVPEAQTYALMLAGLGLIGWRARRRG